MVCWTLATVLVKLAILTLYMRIFTTQSFQRLAIVFIVLTICFGIIYFGFAMSTCVPLSALWNPLPGSKCRDLGAQEIGSLVPDIFLDVCIVALPMPWLLKLRMPLRNKIWVMLIFSLGLAYVVYFVLTP